MVPAGPVKTTVIPDVGRKCAPSSVANHSPLMAWSWSGEIELMAGTSRAISGKEINNSMHRATLERRIRLLQILDRVAGWIA